MIKLPIIFVFYHNQPMQSFLFHLYANPPPILSLLINCIDQINNCVPTPFQPKLSHGC